MCLALIVMTALTVCPCAGALDGPAPAPTPFPRKEAPAPETGLLAGRQAEIFSAYITETENSYSSSNIVCRWEKYTDKKHFSTPARYYVADIYVKDATLIRTYFAENDFSHLLYKSMKKLSKQKKALVAVSGDYARNRAVGLVIRNGKIYRERLDKKRDVGVLYRDGTFETYQAGKVPLGEIKARDPWQSWCFGPELLDQNGKHKEKFNTDVASANPRAAFGYYEPGHYCFVVADGRTRQVKGMTMKELSLLMERLGCIRAINLDGGATAQLAWKGETVNVQPKRRLLNDIIYVGYGEGITGTPAPDSWRSAIRVSEPLFAGTPAPVLPELTPEPDMPVPELPEPTPSPEPSGA